MPSKGGYMVVAPPRHGDDKLHNPPHQKVVLQQQQMMQRRLLQQQRQHQLQPKGRAKAKANEESSSANPANVGDSSMVVALLVPPSVSPASTLKVSNLVRLMESVTPFVEARYSEVNARRLRIPRVDSRSFFYLEDLWESFREWSVYGRGVPLLLYGRDPIQQYYVPFLSGIQLYVDPSKVSNQIRLTSSSGSSGNWKGNSRVDSPGRPLFQFLEHEQPYNRRPLVDKISLLASQFPELSKFRSCDLLPTSWICVAWYPIYRIPVGPTLQDLDASFLTFHSLSTQSRSITPPPQFHLANARYARGFIDPTARISLPVFGLASYKLKGSIVSPCGPEECQQENSLLQAADNWLRSLQVVLPDYQFFRAHHSQWR